MGPMERLQQHADTIAALFAEPWNDRYNERRWHATYSVWIDNEERVCCARLVQRQAAETNNPKYAVSISPRFLDAMNEIHSMADSELTPEQIAVFLRLDQVDAPCLVWEQQQVSNVIAVHTHGVSDRRMM